MFKPMLAGKAPEDLADINYPVLASPKLDGIRCIIRTGGAMSRSLKPIPNEYVRDMLAGLPNGFDGELMVNGDFNAVSSAIMRRTGEPEFIFYAFDWIAAPYGFQARLEMLTEWSERHGHANVRVVEHVEIANAEELAQYEQKCLELGFEGVMVRAPQGPYKFGRSTTREGALLKVKRFAQEEAEVIGFEERMHNGNEAKTNALGRTERSTHAANKTGLGDLGAFRCRTKDGAEFNVGTGFDAAQRVEFWEGRGAILGQTLTFKHQAPPGGRPGGIAPRIPVFIGFRHGDDQ